MSIAKHFILVDDDATNNLISKFSLAKAVPGAIVQSFLEPHQALAAIEENFKANGAAEPTVLFLDINMPLMSGWEFLEVFKTFDKSLTESFTIYILSSSIDERDKQKSKDDLYVSGFVSKPLMANGVLELVKEPGS